MSKLQTTSAAAPRRLGRGLNSLLGTPVKVDVPAGQVAVAADAWAVGEGGVATPVEVGGERIVMVGLDEVIPNRWQPRRAFSEAALSELAASIRVAGVVQPILVRVVPVTSNTVGSTRYELVAGERRWRAARLAGLARLPAVVAELSDEQSAEWALIENVQRADLNAVEQGRAIKTLCSQFGLTHAQAADKLGLDRSSVTNLVRLTELEPGVLRLIEEGRLTAGHGKVLLGIPERWRATLSQKAADEEWSIAELRHQMTMMAARLTDADGSTAKAGPDAQKKGPGMGAGLEELEKQLAEHLGTKVEVRVKAGGKRGKLIVQFYDLDHFDGLMGKMGFVMR